MYRVDLSDGGGFMRVGFVFRFGGWKELISFEWFESCSKSVIDSVCGCF